MKYGFSGTTDKNRSLFDNYSALLHKILTSPAEASGEVNSAFAELVNNAPEFDIGRYWEYVMCAACITAAEHTEELWSTIPADVKEKLNLIMELFLYIGCFSTNIGNEHTTGFHWDGHWSKKWNPNHRFASYGLAFYATNFFQRNGDFEDYLQNFDFDTVMNKVRNAGFTRCIKLWTAPAIKIDEDFETRTVKELFIKSGDAYAIDKYGNVYLAGGGNQPITNRYRIGRMDLLKNLIRYCYSGGPVVSHVDVNRDGVIDAHIHDNSISPVEGQEGMIAEFACIDSTGPRSAINFCIIDFIFATSMLAFCDKFGYPNVCDEYADKIRVGNIDLLYKVDHGYVGVVNGHKYFLPPKSADFYFPTFDLWRKYWETKNV